MSPARGSAWTYLGALGKIVEDVNQVKQARHASADVEDLTWRRGCCEAAIGLQHRDIDQVTAASIAEYGDGFLSAYADEDRHRRGVHGIRSLARAVDIEIAQRSHFQSELMGE